MHVSVSDAVVANAAALAVSLFVSVRLRSIYTSYIFIYIVFRFVPETLQFLFRVGRRVFQCAVHLSYTIFLHA